MGIDAHWVPELIVRLAAASLQSLLLVALVAAACRWLPRLSAAARCRLWWLAALQLLIGLCWPTPLALSAPSWWPALAAGDGLPAAPWPERLPFAIAAGEAANAAPGAGPGLPLWSLALAGLWLAGCLATLAPQVWAWRAARRRLADSQSCEHPDALRIWRRLGVALDLRRMPALRLSAQIESPQLLGPWPATVLLPQARLAGMSAAELEMALHHELEHLRRGDLWWGWVPAAAQWLFFFHPLAHLIAREYALAREAAVDAAVLDSRRYAAQDYGRLLVRLGVGARPQAGLASASPTYLILKRRLTMLHNAVPTSRLLALCLTAAVAALGLAPYRIAAADAAPGTVSIADQGRGETFITELGGGAMQRWAVRGERYYRIDEGGQYREVTDPATRARLKQRVRDSRAAAAQAEVAATEARRAGEQARAEGLRAAEQGRLEAARARAEGLRAAEQGRREAERARREGLQAQAAATREAVRAQQQARREGQQAQTVAAREAARARARQAAGEQAAAERVAEQARHAAELAMREADAAARAAEQAAGEAARAAAEAARRLSREG